MFNALGQISESPLGDHHGQLRHPGLVPPAGDIDRIGPGRFQDPGENPGLFIGVPAGHEVVAGDAGHNREIRPDSLSDLFHHFPAEPGPVFPGPAVIIIPFISDWRQKLADKIPGAAQDLDTIQTRRLGPYRCLNETPLDHFNFFQIHGLGRLPGQFTGNGRGGQSRSAGYQGIGIAARLVQLGK